MTAKTDIDMPSHMSLGEGGQASLKLDSSVEKLDFADV
jgi:hypothetical protein